MLNHKSTRSARLFWLGALLGAAVFLLVYGLAPLDAANDAFCRGGYIETMVWHSLSTRIIVILASQ